MAGENVSEGFLRELASLSQGRKPVWVNQGKVDGTGTLPGPPSDPENDGIDIEGAIVTLLFLQLRKNSASRRATVEISTLGDGTTTYRVVVNGTTENFTPGGVHTKNAALVGLKGQIDGGAEAGNVTTTVTGADELLIDGKTPTSLTSIATSVPAGPGAMTDEIEADVAQARFWSVPAELDAADRLFLQIKGGVVAVTANWVERITSAGLRRVFVELLSADGTVNLWVGPCAVEEG